MKIFPKEEIRDLVIAIIAITLIFSFKPFPTPGIDFNSIPLYFLIVITAFLFHELAHKAVAMKLHCVANYKLWPQGLIMGIIFMIFGLKFVAPGAVVIQPYKFGRWGFRRVHLSTTEMGLISLSGLAVNLFFAVIFLPFGGIFSTLAFVNAWLFLINMLPIPPLDGSKIIQWKMWLWIFLFVIGIFLLIPHFI